MIQAVVVVNGTRYPVPQQGLRIGRAPENDVVLADPNISRQHLVVWSTPRGAFLRDLGSQNGTFIAGRRVGAGPESIPTGAQVRIGVTDLQVEVIQGAEVPVGGGYAAPQNGGYDVPGPQAAPQGSPAYGNGGGSQFGGGAPPYAGGGPAPDPYASPRPATPPRSGSSATGWVIGGVLFVLIVAMVGTGALVMRAVADNRATPTPTSRPVAAAVTATAVPTAAAKPTTAPAAAKPTDAPAKPTAPPATQAPAAPKPTAPAEPKPAGGRDPAFVRALNASVRVIVPTGPGSASTGSGSILTAKGHILTNYHVVSDDNGKLINQGNNIRIAVPPSEGEQAADKYRAKVVDFDQKLDLAIVQIQAMIDGAALPANLGLNPIPIGNSKSVNIGDPITIIGFPGLGGATLTVTRGIHSGIARFSDDPGSFIKTDTEINRGNSGGTAINAAGELIGIPTAGRFDREAPGKIGLVRPIDEAKPLIDKAAR
jgi:S1-C subfamily serine protease